MKVTLTRVTENPVDAIEEAASNCYQSEPSNGKIMKACYRSGHQSVLEFADFTFHVEGVSRALLAQLTRHRIASYAVESQRYCGKNDFEFVVPPSIERNFSAKVKYEKLMEQIRNCYCELQAMGIKNEDARYVLPNACTTTLEVKMNGRSLINFMNLRLCVRAQHEIRELAQLMREEVRKHDEQCEMFAEFLVPTCESHGKDLAFCTESQCCGRHPRLKDVYKRSEENE